MSCTFGTRQVLLVHVSMLENLLEKEECHGVQDARLEHSKQAFEA